MISCFGLFVDVDMGMPAPMHPVLQRSSTYAGGTAVRDWRCRCFLFMDTNANNRRWSLPEMSVGAYAGNPAVGHGESFLGHHM
jgi:hypothetical protein